MSSSGVLVAFQRLVLRPLSVACAVLAVAYLVRRDWLAGAVFVVGFWGVGAIGAGLNPRMSARELARGEAFREKVEGGEDCVLSRRDSSLLANAVLSCAVLCAVGAGVLGVHWGRGVVFGLLAALSVGMGVSLLVVISIGVLAWAVGRRHHG